MRLVFAFIVVPALALLPLLMSSRASAQANPGVGSLLGQPAAQPEPFPEIASTEALVHEIAKRPDAHVAASLLAEARQALRHARALVQSQQPEAAARAQQLAHAALAAASHTIARHQAETELAVARRRKSLAQQSAAAARQALTHTRAQQAAINVAATETTSP